MLSLGCRGSGIGYWKPDILNRAKSVFNVRSVLSFALSLIPPHSVLSTRYSVLFKGALLPAGFDSTPSPRFQPAAVL